MSNSAQILVERKRCPMINKIKLREAVNHIEKALDVGERNKCPFSGEYIVTTSCEKIRVLLSLANSVLNDELVKAKSSMNQEELIEEVFRQIYVPLYPVGKPIYEMTSCEQGLYKQVRIIAIAILAGISKKQEVSFDKEKTAIMNELVNGTGKK